MSIEEDRLGYIGAAKLTGYSVSHLRAKVRERAIPFYKPFGARGRTIFLRSDLEAWLLASRVKPSRRVAS